MRDVAPPTFWQAPLAPAALAATAGVVLDRYLAIPLLISLAGVAAALAAWAFSHAGRQPGLAFLYLLGAVAALGAAYHHWHREVYDPDDVGTFATAEPRPAVLRGALEEEPSTGPVPAHDPLRSIDPRLTTRAVLRVTAVRTRDGWAPASGLARLSVAGGIREAVHVGDEVEVVGRLLAPQGPANPGEADVALLLRDQRVRAQVWVREAPESVRLLGERSPLTPATWLAAVRGWGHRTLEELLPPEQHGLAMALLLGENGMLERAGWDRYQRTGVIHALAISGQHLAILAWFLWLVLRALGVRQRPGAWVVAGFLLAYALMTGGRPPAMRAAVMACALCGAVVLRRPMQLANAFALGWLVVGVLNPTDYFDAGCQLSFLSVVVLFWGLPRWTGRERDPLARLQDQLRPAWEKRLRAGLRRVGAAYGVGLAIWLAVSPLIAFRYHLVSLPGLLIGPPVVLLAAVALLAGFVALAVSPVLPPLAHLAGLLLHGGLAGCDFLVNLSLDVPGAYTYVPDMPPWWVWLCYVLLLAALTVPALRRRGRQVALALLAWLCVGLVAAARPHDGELRCTFLAVGHGGCAVLETPDGRVLLYDVGATGGPGVTRRFVAPYLWSRGVGRVDEVFLSHADLDHYNGLVDLLERFAVGQVSLTPTFADRKVDAVGLTLAALARRGVPTRVLRAGDRLTAGDVSLEVLHPPPGRLGENENARSMVLLVRHEGHAVLLTGDLDGAGRERVLALPKVPVDVLQGPHHGSRVANTPELARWARPRLVVGCQGPPVWPARAPSPYLAVGARVLTTWEHGAVTLRSAPGRLTVETFRTGERWALP